MDVIDSFTISAGYFWLSNFFETPVNGYGSTEAYYLAVKTIDKADRERFKTMDPKTSKKEGRKLTLREDWDVIKDAVMFDAIVYKFDENEFLQEKLIATYPALLVEGNTWHDNYWGDCHCGVRPECETPGKNMLGHMLMTARAALMFFGSETETATW